MIDLILGYISGMGALVAFAWLRSLLRDRSYHNRVAFVWYDLWVGAYYDRIKQIFYIVPIPTIVFIFDWKRDALDGGGAK